jgi:hypothetical protein
LSNRSEPQNKMPDVKRIADASPLNLEEGAVVERSAKKDGASEPQGILGSPSVETVAVPEFDAEVSAEEFFSDKHGILTRGSFHIMMSAASNSAETQWDIDIDRNDIKNVERNTLPVRAVDIPESEARLGPKLAAAIEKMIAFSIQRRWLAEAEAFRKVSLQPNLLSSHDRSGIGYVLTVAERFADSRIDASLVRKLLRANRNDGIVDNKAGKISASVYAPRVGDVSSIVAGKVRSRSPSAKKIESLDRVREVAENQDWLTAKASRAFGKLKGERGQIDRAELAALQYLVDQFDMIIEVKSDVELLKKEIKKILGS